MIKTVQLTKYEVHDYNLRNALFKDYPIQPDVHVTLEEYAYIMQAEAAYQQKQYYNELMAMARREKQDVES